MTAPPPSTPSPPISGSDRRPGLRGFLQGPRLADRKGFLFLIVIFVIILVVFAIAFYEFTVTLRPLPSGPVQFSPAVMVAGNGTFNVTSVSNGSWPWQNFIVNLTINNFGAAAAVPLAASGRSAVLLVGSLTHKDYYDVVWEDLDHDGRVSVGDVFWVTGNGVPLPTLSYVAFSLSWGHGAWTSVEYFVTSSTIV